MKRIGVLAVHYGKEYLAWAVKSLAEAVDEVHVFYTASPSFGFSDSNIPNPDTEDELFAQANKYAKPQWHRIAPVTTEGDHRQQMYSLGYSSGAELMAIADADEVWDPATLRTTLDLASIANRAGRWLMPFHNFWRSWQWTIKDHFHPIRIVDMRHDLTKDDYVDNLWLEGALHLDKPWPVFHFGYAQCEALMRYKMGCHGHKAEFREGWLENKFFGWDPTSNNEDLHPSITNFWKAEPTDPATLIKLDQLMFDHPYRGLDRIV